MEEEYENLYFAVCQRAVEDYKNNLKIIEHTQSDIVREKAQKDNNQIEKFLGEKIIGMIHNRLANEKKRLRYKREKETKLWVYILPKKTGQKPIIKSIKTQLKKNHDLKGKNVKNWVCVPVVARINQCKVVTGVIRVERKGEEDERWIY